MKIRFDKTYLRELYETGRTSDKKHRLQPEIVSRYQLRIKTLGADSTTVDLGKLGKISLW